MNEILSIQDSARFVELEVKIKAGLANFIEVGEALMEIRDSKFYRIEHGTFEEYCREKWGFTKTQANRLISASAVNGNLTPMGVKPANERQTRPLSKVAPEKQSLVWQDAVGIAGGKQPTAAQVEQAVDNHTSKRESVDYSPSDGMQYAEMAILNLEKIQPNDTQRQKAFDRVIKWISKHK